MVAQPQPIGPDYTAVMTPTPLPPAISRQALRLERTFRYGLGPTLRRMPQREASLVRFQRMFAVAARRASRVPSFVQVNREECEHFTCEWVRAGEGVDERKLVFFFHGGGYFFSSPELHRPMTWRLSRALARPVLALEYCLAPEGKVVERICDALRAYRALLDRGYAPENIIIAGDSAGGHMTLATLLMLRDEGGPMPRAAICISPWADMSPNCESRRAYQRTDPFISPEGIRWLGAIQSRGLDPYDPIVSPVYGDYIGLPPMMLMVSAAEVLCDDTRRVAERAREAGVPVRHEEWPGMLHDFPVMADLIPEGKRAFKHIADFVRAVEAIV